MNQIEHHRYQHVKEYYDERHLVAKKIKQIFELKKNWDFLTGFKVILSRLLLFDVIIWVFSISIGSLDVNNERSVSNNVLNVSNMIESRSFCLCLWKNFYQSENGRIFYQWKWTQFFSKWHLSGGVAWLVTASMVNNKIIRSQFDFHL